MIAFHRKLTQSLLWLVTLFFVVIGVSSAFTITPFQVPDESAHWSSAVFRSKNFLHFPRKEVICTRAFGLPEHFDYERILAHPEERLGNGKFKTAGEAPEKCLPDQVPYGFFASYPGVFLSSFFFRDSLEHPQEILRWFYASRVLQGLLVLLPLLRICWIQSSLVSGMAGLSPLPLLMLMISPLFIQQSFGISSDAVVLSFTSYLLFFLFYYRSAKKWDYAALLALGILACETKPNIFPFVSLLVLMGFVHRSVGSTSGGVVSGAYPWKRSSWDWFVFGVLGAVTCISLWQFLTTPSHTKLYLPAGVNAGQQISLFKEHSVTGIWFLIRSYFSELGFSQFTSKLGWLDTNIAKATANYWRLLLGLSFLLESVYLGFQFRSRVRPDAAQPFMRRAPALGLLYLLGTGAVTFSGVATCWVMYANWTPVGGALVEGLQPRYFLPNFMLCLALGLVLIQALFDVKVQPLSESPSPSRPFIHGWVIFFAGILILFGASFQVDLLMRYF